ncbi:hypothetical protein [Fredinandcohnia onubensis]|uniref:hypothetical protein n=1 Tax=Fredinandcohnia onubensis TaxID=1571209 RepID=UPI000C0BE425|nr:hypothetical protein [Fredinandcohnia onubensis]
MEFPTREQFWQFSPIERIEDSNFDKTLERFYKSRVSGLVRENIQNSLDGRLPNLDGPVKVIINTGTIKREEIPGIEEAIEHIKTLRGRNSYTKETIEHMQSKMLLEEVKYISFEDRNTRGLSGAKNGQSNSDQDTWSIYAYNKGVHSLEESEELETERGGSHGVGKIASNAASDLHLMYFANCDGEGNQHLGGTIQLIEHEYHNQSYRSTGYFTNICMLGDNKSKFYPFENHFKQVFEKNTRGLKIIIPFLRDEYDNERQIVISICDSFFVSIIEKKLEVVVNNNTINYETIMSFVNNADYYVQEIPEMKKEFTPLYVNTYLNETPRTIVVSDSVDNFKFNLYFQYNEEITKGRVAVIRTIGMKIEDFKVKNNATKPFNAVLIGGPAEDAYLKSLENESHTELSYEHIKDKQLEKRAKKFISNLSREVANVIEEAIKENNPVDGKIDTKDILYVIENQFKKDLSASMGTVVVNKGRSLVKMTEDIPRKKKKQTDKPDKERKKREKNKEPVKRVTPKPKDSDENDQDRAVSSFSVHPKIVQRLIFGNNEVVKFDFTQSELIQNEKSCNIKLSVIDGMGVEYNDEFNIRDNFVRVIDIANNSEREFNENHIKDVSIQDGIAQILFELKPNYNKALKFIYYVEV